jgi:hypothetical protein
VLAKTAAPFNRKSSNEMFITEKTAAPFNRKSSNEMFITEKRRVI